MHPISACHYMRCESSTGRALVLHGEPGEATVRSGSFVLALKDANVRANSGSVVLSSWGAKVKAHKQAIVLKLESKIA